MHDGLWIIRMLNGSCSYTCCKAEYIRANPKETFLDMVGRFQCLSDLPVRSFYCYDKERT